MGVGAEVLDWYSGDIRVKEKYFIDLPVKMEHFGPSIVKGRGQNSTPDTRGYFSW